MNSVHTDKEIETATKNTIQVLYGDGIGDLKIRTLLPFPTEQKREVFGMFRSRSSLADSSTQLTF